MWAALRHRRGQVVALGLVAALVATCAAFAPIFARSVDQAVLRAHVERADPGESATTISRGRTQGTSTDLPRDLQDDVPEDLSAVSGDPVLEARTATRVVTAPGKKPSPVVLRARSGVCDQVTVQGRCPNAANEVLVSSADAKANDWGAGTHLSVPQESFPGGPAQPPVELTVVGVYTVGEAPGYWLGDRPDGKSGIPLPDHDNLPGVDDLLTVEETFAGSFPRSALRVELPLDPGATTLDSLPAAASAVEDLAAEHSGLSVDMSLRALEDATAKERSQTAVIVPFVALQLALLSLVVLFLVAQATVEDRRHDVALARLRGRSRAGARRLLLTELAIPVVCGVPLGLVAAMGLAVLVRAVLLPSGIPFEVPLGVLPWLLGALVLSLLAVAVAARPVLREPVSQLLRGVPSDGATRGPRVVESVVVVLAVVSVVGLATGAVGGPAALAAPMLLAIAVGLVAARLLPVAAARQGARALRRGRVSGVITAHGIGRRTIARRVLVVTTVVTALVVFGANAVVVADRNRQARAELETGAPAVMTVDAASVSELQDAAGAVEDVGVDASPVVTIAPTNDEAATTIAVTPSDLATVAHPDTVDGLDTAALALPDQEPVDITGKRLTGTIAWDLSVPKGVEEPPTLQIDLTTATGDVLTRDVHVLGPADSGRARIGANVLCPDRCRLDALRVSASGNPGSRLTGSVTLTGLAVDGTDLPVTDEDTWADAGGDEQETGLTVTAKGEALHLDVRARDGADVVARVADVPHPLPAIVSAPLADRGEVTDVVRADGGQAEVEVVQEVSALPAVTDEGVLVSLPALGRVSNALDTERTRVQLWLGDASTGVVDRARTAVEEAGVPVRGVETTADADRVYDRSASAWGLQLALLAAALAVLLGAIVLIVLAASGWRPVVADLAALRIAGVSRPDAARSLRREWLVGTLAGVLLGLGSGVAGAAVAMSSIPLFTDPAPVPVPDLSPAWWAVALATAVSALLLPVLGVLLARSVMGRVRPSAARGESA